MVCVDLFCGLGGWAEGFLAEGYDVFGFDVERHLYPDGRGYPGQLILQDVLTVTGRQIAHPRLACIVASPPCQEYSYMAMPWKRAKAIAAALRGQGEFPEGYTGSRTVEQLNALFNACFRIQREVSDALGRHIPMVVENVKGAQPWVGRACANFGSYYLWGDVAMVGKRIVRPQPEFGEGLTAPRIAHKIASDHLWLRDPKLAAGKYAPNYTAAKVPGLAQGTFPGGGLAQGWIDGQHEKDGKGGSFQSAGVKARDADGYIRTHTDAFGWKSPRTSSRSAARKHASAVIAKIPAPLAEHVARMFKPLPEVKP